MGMNIFEIKLLKKIKKAGFNWIGMGIESGNQTVRQEVSKGSFKVVDINDVLDVPYPDIPLSAP